MLTVNRFIQANRSESLHLAVSLNILNIATLSLNVTQINPNNALVSLFTVRMMENGLTIQLKSLQSAGLHFTPGLQSSFYPQFEFQVTPAAACSLQSVVFVLY